jgi:hypothetical protein
VVEVAAAAAAGEEGDSFEALRALALEFATDFAALDGRDGERGGWDIRDGVKADNEGGVGGMEGVGGVPVGGRGEEVICKLLYDGHLQAQVDLGWGPGEAGCGVGKGGAEEVQPVSLRITVKMPWAAKSCDFDLEVRFFFVGKNHRFFFVCGQGSFVVNKGGAGSFFNAICLGFRVSGLGFRVLTRVSNLRGCALKVPRVHGRS